MSLRGSLKTAVHNDVSSLVVHQGGVLGNRVRMCDRKPGSRGTQKAHCDLCIEGVSEGDGILSMRISGETYTFVWPTSQDVEF